MSEALDDEEAAHPGAPGCAIELPDASEDWPSKSESESEAFVG